MSNPWDVAARNKLAVKPTANWFAWCDRHGFTEVNPEWYPMGRRYWSREHFKVALNVMPRDHPDRWKYETGRRYAPTHYANEGSPWRETFWAAVYFIPTMLGILLAYVYLIGQYWIQGTVCIVALSLPWLIWLLLRWRALRR